MNATDSNRHTANFTDWHSEMAQVLNCVADLLSELVDSEADAECYTPRPPAGEYSQSIAALLYPLRQELICKDEVSLDSGCETAQLRSVHGLLLRTLDDLLEIVGSSGLLAVGWSEVERRFRWFARSLSTYLAYENRPPPNLEIGLMVRFSSMDGWLDWHKVCCAHSLGGK